MRQTYHLPLIRKETVAQDTLSFTFDASGTDYTFEAGQYAYITLLNPKYEDADSNTRLFSFYSSPQQSELSIVMRYRPSGYKRSLAELPLGSLVSISKALGVFALPPESTNPVIFVAGGVGIAPFYSLLQDAQHKRSRQRIYLFYSNPSIQKTVFFDELHKLIAAMPDVSFHPTLTQDASPEWAYHTGRWTAKSINNHILDLSRTHVYLAGHSNFVDDLTDQLIAVGVPLHNIKMEAFTGYEAQAIAIPS